MDTGEVSLVCTGGVSLVSTGECLLCAQGECFLFVSLINGRQLASSAINRLKVYTAGTIFYT